MGIDARKKCIPRVRMIHTSFTKVREAVAGIRGALDCIVFTRTIPRTPEPARMKIIRS